MEPILHIIPHPISHLTSYETPFAFILCILYKKVNLQSLRFFNFGKIILFLLIFCA